MAWDFSTDPQWAEQLGWVEEFVRSEWAARDTAR
jgi:acyl-CoA dehydrogenase